MFKTSLHHLRRVSAVIVLLLAGFALLLLAAAPAPAVAQDGIPCDEPGGAVEQRRYFSTATRQNMEYAIYTPPCYTRPDQAERLYPVIYLMHGSDAVDTAYWLRLGLVEMLDAGIAAGVLPPVIVVLPFGGEIANLNQFGPVSWHRVVLDDLLPDVESAFRADARREARAIGGISRGGFWAFNIAMQRPDVFAIVGGHSPFFHLDHWRPANPLFLAEDAPNLDMLRIWMDAGSDDYARPMIDLMHRRLYARGIAHAYIVNPGGRHTRDYWAAHVFDYLVFYTAEWLAPDVPPASTPPALGSGGSPFTPLPARSLPGLSVFVPATGARSTQMAIASARLAAIRAGEADERLVLDTPTVAALAAQGVALNPAIRVVAPEDLLPILDRDRTAFTLRAFEGMSPRFRMMRVDEVDVLHGLIDDDLDDYPFAFPGSGFRPERLTTVMLSGVTAIVRVTAAAVDRNGTAWAASGLRGLTRRADFFHVSNEVSFHATCPNFEGGRPPGPFCARDAYFEVLRDLGADIIELSGNHNLDYGPDAYLRTLDMYRAAGMATVGGGQNLAAARQPLTIMHNGNRIALLSCNWSGPQMALATESAPGAAYCDSAWLEAEIPRLKATHDVLIVTVQYREFDQHAPTPGQRADFRRLADLGADVVIGTQAHLPQTFEFYPVARGGEAFIHYGLGNVYFDQTYFYMRAYMPELYIYAGELRAIDLMVTIIDDYGRPRPMDAHNRAHFLSHMAVQ